METNCDKLLQLIGTDCALCDSCAAVLTDTSLSQPLLTLQESVNKFLSMKVDVGNGGMVKEQGVEEGVAKEQSVEEGVMKELGVDEDVVENEGVMKEGYMEEEEVVVKEKGVDEDMVKKEVPNTNRVMDEGVDGGKESYARDMAEDVHLAIVDVQEMEWISVDNTVYDSSIVEQQSQAPNVQEDKDNDCGQVINNSDPYGASLQDDSFTNSLSMIKPNVDFPSGPPLSSDDCGEPDLDHTFTLMPEAEDNALTLMPEEDNSLDQEAVSCTRLSSEVVIPYSQSNGGTTPDSTPCSSVGGGSIGKQSWAVDSMSSDITGRVIPSVGNTSGDRIPTKDEDDVIAVPMIVRSSSTG